MVASSGHLNGHSFPFNALKYGPKMSLHKGFALLSKCKAVGVQQSSWIIKPFINLSPTYHADHVLNSSQPKAALVQAK